MRVGRERKQERERERERVGGGAPRKDGSEERGAATERRPEGLRSLYINALGL